jgi:geranylgeranyl reductase family protein
MAGRYSVAERMVDKVHDVVVVGAGPGGSAAAHYLAKGGLDVLLLDRAEFPRDKTCGDGLTPRALGVLQDMGILDRVRGFAFQINGIELYGTRGGEMVAPIPQNEHYPNHLLIAPRFRLDEIIFQRAVESGAQFQGNIQVRGAEQYADHAEVHASHQGKEVCMAGRIVVLAVGSNLGLLNKMGFVNRSPGLILAVRGYYEGLRGLHDRVQVHFDQVPLPGYAWVFPLSETRANVGIGFWKDRMPWKKLPPSPKIAFDRFLAHNPQMKAMMANASLEGQVKGFPLRVDFTRSKTCDRHILLVGESAGLVSPFTGEGIDFALESGRLAAGFIQERFNSGDFSPASLLEYDALLRAHFQRLFVFLTRIRRLYLNPFIMDRAIMATNQFPDMKELLAKILVSQEDAASLVTFPVMRKVLLGV